MTTTASLALREVDGFALATFDDEAEARVRDADIGARLGHDRARDVRKLIERNRVELERFGPICCRATVARQLVNGGAAREYEVTEYWLNEGQALLVAALSRTERAADVREMLIRVFMKARRGEMAPATPSASLSIEAARELGRSIVEPLLAQYAQHAATVDTKLDEHGSRLARLEANVDKIARGKRREITTTTKADHARAARLFGGLCPCCSVERVLADDGSVTGEFDHFFAAQAPDVDHTWLICKRCHADFTYSRVDRTARTPEFAAYQNRRRRLPGRQPGLPGVN